MCRKRWQRGRSQKCSIRVSRLIGRRCKIGVDNCRRQLHLLTEDTEGSNSVSAECCWDFGMQIKSSSAITAMKIKTLYYWKRFQKCKEVLKLTATRQRKTHWTRKYCGSEPYPRETITGCASIPSSSRARHNLAAEHLFWIAVLEKNEHIYTEINDTWNYYLAMNQEPINTDKM
jgi:hypothetical protein